MKNTVLISICIATILSACTPSDKETIARNAAKSFITSIVADKFPNAPAKAIVDCTIDNASNTELLSLGAAAVSGNTTDATAQTLELMSKPSAAICIAKAVALGNS